MSKRFRRNGIFIAAFVYLLMKELAVAARHHYKKHILPKVIFGIAFAYLLSKEIGKILYHRVRSLAVRRNWSKRSLITPLAIFLLVIASSTYWLLGNRSPNWMVPGVLAYSVDEPDETLPGPDYPWQGAPDDPKKISIPSLSIDHFIQKVGVDQNQQIAVPNNVHIAGWFVDSMRPGQKGLSIIDGHVDGRLQPDAVFKQLAQAQKDAEITIIFGDGSSKTFRIISVLEVPATEAPAYLFSQNPSLISQLNLITCSGTYDSESRQYDKRIIVTAGLISEEAA